MKLFPLLTSLIVAAIACICSSTVVYAGDSGAKLSAVPAEFRGEWTSDSSGAGFDTDDGRLAVHAREIEGWEWSGDIVWVKQIGPRTIVVKSKGFAEGDPFESELTLELSADGSVLLTKPNGADSWRALYRARGGSR